MRRREIQSCTLKLNDLKEYEAVRQTREIGKMQDKTVLNAGSTPHPLVKYGPKTKQEVRERLGLM